jgi:hypothetical protein
LFGTNENNYTDSNNVDLDNGIRIIIKEGEKMTRGGFTLVAHYLAGSGIRNYTALGQ